MGRIGDITVPETDVPIPGSKVGLTVRGLSADDIAAIYGGCKDEIDELFDLFRDGQELGLANVVKAIMDRHVGLACNIIAYANDSPDQAAKVRTFPVAVQLQALSEIGRLTIVSTADVKKILASMIEGSEGMNEILAWTGPGSTNDSPNGSGTSVES